MFIQASGINRTVGVARPGLRYGFSRFRFSIFGNPGDVERPPNVGRRLPIPAFTSVE
jgi:hypothetical protein